MKRVQVLAGISKPSVNLAGKVRRILAGSFQIVDEKPDLIIVTGGDGTLLHYLRELDYPTTPFLGIDAGSLGFFQEIGKSDLPDLAQNLKGSKYSFQKLPLLELSDSSNRETLAFNEFAVERASARAAHLSLELDNHRFEKFIGDGIIVATPQGSTAYAGAAGGAVIPYSLRAFQIVPSNPHDSALYKALRQPLVLSASDKLKVEVLDAKERPVRVVADGHEVETGKSFELGLSRRSVTMVRTEKFNFYARLSSKLIG